LAVPGVTIVSPDPAIRWRVAAGSVQQSSDGGSTWTQAAVTVRGVLLAGASPAPATCWLVGASGLVVLTADGTTWTRVSFPQAVDLTSVAAVDSRSATVTTADGRRFETHDGGGSWAAVPAATTPR
jgi:photosystem II stability/assembly factor-like uncharacterized protein